MQQKERLEGGQYSWGLNVLFFSIYQSQTHLLFLNFDCKKFQFYSFFFFLITLSSSLQMTCIPIGNVSCKSFFCTGVSISIEKVISICRWKLSFLIFSLISWGTKFGSTCALISPYFDFEYRKYNVQKYKSFTVNKRNCKCSSPFDYINIIIMP